ncbi:unnamed protein product [Urochloa humidicola]
MRQQEKEVGAAVSQEKRASAAQKATEVAAAASRQKRSSAVRAPAAQKDLAVAAGGAPAAASQRDSAARKAPAAATERVAVGGSASSPTRSPTGAASSNDADSFFGSSRMSLRELRRVNWFCLLFFFRAVI